jgi:lysophospholipase L1-like esterase
VPRVAPAVLLASALIVLAGCSSSGDDREAAASTPPAAASSSPTSPAPPTGYDEYVALGDSYTAAPLVPPTDSSSICLRSGSNYPSLVARAMPGTRLTDVSCSGATSQDMTRRQRAAGHSVPPQFAALSRRTDLVTIGLGGNDGNLFGTLLIQCTQLAQSDPDGAPCDAAQARSGRLAATLHQIRQHIAGVVDGVHSRSPHARILVVGYPQIVPASGTCDLLPLAAGDYAFARRVNRGLTDVVRRGADDAGADYVDVWTPSAGHDICSDDPWINGRVTSADTALAYHPLAVEQQAVGDLVLAALR